jgi:hypothetical protein
MGENDRKLIGMIKAAGSFGPTIVAEAKREGLPLGCCGRHDPHDRRQLLGQHGTNSNGGEFAERRRSVGPVPCVGRLR